MTANIRADRATPDVTTVVWAQPDEDTADDIIVRDGRPLDAADRRERRDAVVAVTALGRKGTRHHLAGGTTAFVRFRELAVVLRTPSTDNDTSQELVVAVLRTDRDVRAMPTGELLEKLVTDACAVATRLNRTLDADTTRDQLAEALELVPRSRVGWVVSRFRYHWRRLIRRSGED